MDLEPIRRFVPALVASMALAGVGVAQDTYRLSDDDTWDPARQVDPTSPEGQLAAAREALAQQQYDRAQNLASRWIERYDRHPLLPDAYLVRADALVGRHDEYEALYDYEYLIRAFPGSEAFITACERELEIAREYAAGKKRKLWGFRVIGAKDEAQELLIRIQERLPGSRVAEQAGMELADYYFRTRQMSLAVDAYGLFIENYPKSPQVNKARARLIYSYLASFKGPEFDAKGLYEARIQLRRLMALEPAAAQQIPADALLIRINESDAQKMLATAKWYVKVGDPISAEYTLRRMLHTEAFLRTVAASEALRLIPDVLAKLPPDVLRQTPDYESLRKAILGSEVVP
jgi:outer membrane protein assembly factor BamD (BamD/ComL family)